MSVTSYLVFSSPANSVLYVGSYEPLLIGFSIIVATFASYAALLVSQLVQNSRGTVARRLWTAGGGLCLGVGIWAMHFVGMLAFSLPCSSSYDASLTLLSTVPSILASTLAMKLISRNRLTRGQLILGGLLIGAGIGAMHYAGMAAMRFNGFIRYDIKLFLLSIVVAVVLATLALWIKFRMPSWQSHWSGWVTISSAVVLGLAVSGMHYTAMAAAYFVRGGEGGGVSDASIAPTFLAAIVLASTGLIIVVTIVATYAGKPTRLSFDRPYKLIGLLLFGWITIAWLGADYYYTRLGLAVYRREAQLAAQKAEQVAQNFNENILLLKGISWVMASDVEISVVLQRFGAKVTPSQLSLAARKQRWSRDKKFAELNRFLATAAANLGADNVFIMNAAGDCIAASNADKADSFVGTNYADREYFRQARAGQRGHQYAVGRTSNIPGLYYSSPVVVANRFLGAVIVKRSIAKFSHWTNQANAFIADANGVIVLAPEKHREFHYLPNAAVLGLSPEKRQLQYKQSSLDALKISAWEEERFSSALVIEGDAHPIVLASKNLPENGITVYASRSLAEIVRMDNEKYWLFFLLSAAGGMLLVAVSAIVLYMRESKSTAAELRIAATAFEAQEGMMITDENNNILRVNSSFTAITGYTDSEIIGKNPKIFSSGRQDAQFYAVMWSSIINTGAWEGEIWNRRKNGEIFPEYLTITAVKEPSSGVTSYVATFNDITASKVAEDKIKNLAFYDPLTRLPNRRLLMDRLQQALASSSRSGREGALLYIDLDNFKVLNDTLGHATGDILLQQVAERLMASVREGDTVARLGGDEFMVLLEDLSGQAILAAKQTEVVGGKILEALNQPYQLDTHQYLSTPSIGATLFNNNRDAIDDLFKQADIAMYHSKKAGRNTLRFFDPQMQEAITSRATLENELRNALVKQEFQLHYQIQVDSSQRAVGAEVLIRWILAGQQMVSPAQFIPLAEETGLILPIGQWVLETACAQLQTWQQNAATRDLVLAVNVSAKQFHQVDFAEQVMAVIERYAINPNRLKLELTESMLVDNIVDIIATMNTLNEVGVKFSLDDFGTGYSSLQYLKKLPLNQLKIDQSFVRDIEVDSSDRAIVRTIIAMAKSLNLEIIAEGVETKEQQKILLDKGCTHYQGYLFGKPLPIEQFEALLKI